MGLSLVSGVFNEDFDYGYPYDKIVGDSAPEFEYSGEARTHSGAYKSSFYGRKWFTLHYQNHKLEPKNYDVGIHGGSHDNNYHYLLFPVLQWNQVQVLTLVVYLSAPGVLSYDKGFDGYHKDEFYVVVNNVARHFHNNTAGHGWLNQTTTIGKGWNTIQFVLKTAKYVPPTTRGGTSVSSKPPNLPRYLRLTSINITNVQLLKDSPHAYAKMLGTGTMTSTAHLNAYSGEVDAIGYGSLFQGFMSGAVFMTGDSSFLTDWLTERDMGQAVLQGDSSLTINASIDQNHEAYDGGVEIGTHGDLSIFVPIDQPQTIADRTKPLTTTYFDYSVTPVVVNGKLIVPSYMDTQTSTISSAHGYAYTDAVSVTSINHVLPVTPTYRWLATDISGNTDDPVSSWPEHSSVSNPAWQSTGIYRPTIHPHEHFSTEGLNVLTYSRVVHTWWENVQHMWINMGTRPTSGHYTWQMVALVHPMPGDLYQYVLDIGQAPPADYTDQINADNPVFINDGMGTARSGFGFYPTGVRLWDQTHGRSVWKTTPMPVTRPQVITVVYGDNTVHGVSGATVYQHGYRLNNRINAVVPITTNPHWLLGRWQNEISKQRSSHMSIMEIEFFDRALTSAEVTTCANYLMGVYAFNRYK